MPSVPIPPTGSAVPVDPSAPVNAPTNSPSNGPVVVPKEPVVGPKEPVVVPKEPVLVVVPKEPIAVPKEPVVVPKEPVVITKPLIQESNKILNTNQGKELDKIQKEEIEGATCVCANPVEGGKPLCVSEFDLAKYCPQTKDVAQPKVRFMNKQYKF